MSEYRVPRRSRGFVRPFALALSAALLVPISAAADSTADNHLSRGFALQFGVTGGSVILPNLTSGLGTLVSGTYHFDPRIALRFGLSANYSETTDQHVGGSQSDTSTSSASATLDWLLYLNPGNRMKAYFGLGATAGMSTSGSPVPNILPPDSWNAGARGCLGAEWFFAKNLSLWAEYGASLGYAISSPPNGTATSRTVVNFSPTPVKLGLSVYFRP